MTLKSNKTRLLQLPCKFLFLFFTRQTEGNIHQRTTICFSMTAIETATLINGIIN